MSIFNAEIISSKINPQLYGYDAFPLKNADKTLAPATKTNPYFAFDKSIHYTLADYNRLGPNQQFSLESLHSILKSNWISSDYSSATEANKFFTRGLIMLAKYFRNPQDEGGKSIVINKILTSKLTKNQFILARLDKIYEKKDGAIELVDYKTGKVINHKDNFNIDFRTAVYLVLIYEKLSIFPNYISYYYLYQNKKFTRYITLSDVQYAYSYLHRNS